MSAGMPVRALFLFQQPDKKKGLDRDISVMMNVNGTPKLYHGVFVPHWHVPLGSCRGLPQWLGGLGCRGETGKGTVGAPCPTQ